MVEELTLREIEERLDMLEKLIARERDVEKLKVWNTCFQKLIDEQARRLLAETE